MKKTNRIAIILLFALSFFPFLNTNVSAVSNHLISFSGSQISGGLPTRNLFRPINNYVVVNATILRWNPPADWTQRKVDIPLNISLQMKTCWFGYDTMATVKKWPGMSKFEFVAHQGKEYRLYFNSSNFNYYNCSGTVYGSR